MTNYTPDAENRTPVYLVPQNTENGCSAPETAPKMPALADRLAMALCPVLGYFFWIAGEQEWSVRLSDTLVWAYGYFVFCLLFLAGALLYGKAKLGRLPGESWFWAGCTAVMGSAITFDRLNAVPSDWAWLLWIAFAGYTVLTATGQLTGSATGPALPLDGLRGIGQGFAGLATWPKGLWQWATAPRTGKTSLRRVAAIALCVCLAAVLFFTAAGWLGAADKNFAGVLEGLAIWKNWQFSPDYIIYLFFAVPTGAFFYGISAGGWAALRQNPRPALAQHQAGLERLRCLPVGLGCGILYAFCGLYALFFGMQGSYLFGGLTGSLPEGFTIANYARQGFFELCAVMLLNLALVAGSAALAEKPLCGNRALQIAASALLGESLLLWVTAAAKLWLYIAAFGFTAKRLLAAWALVVLAMAASRTLTALWKRCAVVRPTVFVAAALWAALYLY